MERLQKVMATCGIASRRKCEEMILQGKVVVNGVTVTTLGTKVDLSQDEILVDGERISQKEATVTIVLNKPEGYVTTASDQFHRPCVLDLIDIPERIYPVGRLDYQTSGLLLLTNDGDLSYRLTHPKHHVAKVYQALCAGVLTEAQKLSLERGVVLEDGFKTGKAKVGAMEVKGGNTRLEITIYEGKNHQIRRMMKAVGHPVLKLKRIQEGPLRLGRLKEGQWRVLSTEDVQTLKKACEKS